VGAIPTASAFEIFIKRIIEVEKVSDCKLKVTKDLIKDKK
jgi:hypothetical protein